MRGGSRRGSDSAGVSLRSFEWSHATLATLCHSTVTPEVSGAVPLSDMANLGARDRLSLVGQFAAHVAMLQFASVADCEFDAAQWLVIRKRGSDCRLVRIASREAQIAPTALDQIRAIADAIGAPAIDALRQSWTRAESAYAEIHGRLRDDAAADLRWLRRAAAGEILWPGAEALALMWKSRGPHFGADAAAFRAYVSLDPSTQLLELGSEFPIQRYAALSSFDRALPGSQLAAGAVADRLIERLAAGDCVAIVCGRVDDESRRVIEIVRRNRAIEDVAGVRRIFALSTRIAAQRSLEERQLDVATFVTSDAYPEYLDRGLLPVDDSRFASTPEPRRSYIAALALLGVRVPLQLARDFLKQFFFEQPLDHLVVEGVTSIDEDDFVFASEPARAHCSRHIPEASRGALCRAAASVADATRAGLLLIEAGDAAAGTKLLESIRPIRATETIAALSSIPRSSLTPLLATRLAQALIDEGRYTDARELAPLAQETEREYLLARCDRRTGDYATALSRLERIDSASALRIELLRLAGRFDEARAITIDDAAGLAYERALVDLDENGATSAAVDHPYFGPRLATYRALEQNDFGEAVEQAAQSAAAARCAIERIDAGVDRVFASFSAGRWELTRAIALECLATVDEAQGDRAAAGILFTLTFVEIDDARWSTATRHIERLRQYYTRTHDEHRLAELALLSGYLEFSRANFADARRFAECILQRKNMLSQIREAAALMLDEIDWIEQRSTPLRSRGNSCNREFEDRHRLMCIRRGASADGVGGFTRALATWERSPSSIPPVARTRSEKLKLLRSALAVERTSIVRDLAAELSIAIPDGRSSSAAADVDVLRIAASADYPFRNDTFPVAWCYSTRNRLGHWSQEGSQTFDPSDLDSIGKDWIQCSDRELLYIEGCSGWSDAARTAVGALFRTRAENYRLRRVIEQEETSTATKPAVVEGIVGESAAMRAVFALVEKIAPRDVPVCVLGESGTGKELIGRAIHRSSGRRTKLFNAINCAALPENLVESELFGHVRGAFTGADRDRAGVIETTDGGTLFLDEIGEMPLSAQAKLLRFLQDGEFRRVGDSINRTADVRIVSATNRKLETAAEEGRFREDLYYRVRGVEIALPALRERGDDVMLLAGHFLSRERAKHKAGPQRFANEVETLMRSYNWPGNVRELQNTIRAAHAIAGEAREIDIEHLPERVRNTRPARTTLGSYQDEVARFRRDLIEKSLASAAGNQNRAAALLKISRQALAYQIRELGIMVGKPAPRARL